MTSPHPAGAPALSEPRHFDYIDAVRGYAFLAVLLHHVSKIGGHFPGRWIWVSGYYGVQLFFLASAITLCYSMGSRQRKEKRPILFFFIRRLFRIGPMFWLAMIFYWCLPLDGVRRDWLKPFTPPGAPSSIDFILNALFLHGWMPSSYTSIVPGGWSIAVEMNFYLIFPILFRYIRSLKQAAAAVMAGMLFTFFYFRKFVPFLHSYFLPNMPHETFWHFRELIFPAQFAVFLIGIFSYHLLRENEVKHIIDNKLGASVCLIMSLFFFKSFLQGQSGFIPIELLTVMTLAGIIIALSRQTMPWLINSWIRYLGKISFSCYLIHFAVLSFVFKLFGVHLNDNSMWYQPDNNLSSIQNILLYLGIATATLFLTAGISTLTLHLVENPGIALGRRLINRLNSEA
jgi:peptidoglycan/LPS O-acetylase OafA/YrhL